MKPFKYQQIILEQNLTTNCPFEDCVERNIVGFRWVKQPLVDIDNFLPKLILDKKHNNPPRRNNHTEKTICSEFGLSMFESRDIATKKFNGFTKRTRGLLGYSHVAKGELSENDGVVTPVSRSGHFDLFEYENVSLSDKFELIGELEND